MCWCACVCTICSSSSYKDSGTVLFQISLPMATWDKRYELASSFFRGVRLTVPTENSCLQQNHEVAEVAWSTNHEPKRRFVPSKWRVSKFHMLGSEQVIFFSQGSKIGVACHSHTPSPRNVECTAICAWSCLFIFQTSSKFNNCIKQKNLEQKMIWDAENTFQSSTPGGYLGLLSYIKQFQLKIQTCFQLTHTCPPKKPKSQIMWTHTILRSNIKSVMRVPRKWMAGTTMLRTRLTLLYAGYELFFFHVAAKLTRLDD